MLLQCSSLSLTISLTILYFLPVHPVHLACTYPLYPIPIKMPHEKTTVPCESRGERFKPTGLGLHRKSCLKNKCKTGKDLAFVEILRNSMFSTLFLPGTLLTFWAAAGPSQSNDHSDTISPSGPGNSPSHGMVRFTLNVTNWQPYSDLDEFWTVPLPDEQPMSTDSDPGLHGHGMPLIEPKCIN